MWKRTTKQKLIKWKEISSEKQTLNLISAFLLVYVSKNMAGHGWLDI